MKTAEYVRNTRLKWISFGILTAVVLTGIWARFADLAWHFTHIDDLGVAKSIVDAKLRKEFFFFATVPLFWTYAPLQFMFTKLIVHPEQSYREVLFWGRFPSAVFGSAGILAMIWFGSKAYAGRVSMILISSMVVALSLENIIHAKQMHNYALGVTSAILLLTLLQAHLERKNFPFWWMGLNGLACAAFAAAQYQLLFFLPGFFLVTLIHGLRSSKNRFLYSLNWVLSGAFFAAAFYPVWFYFLSRHSKSSMPGWNGGKAAEFVLTFDGAENAWERLTVVLKFFVSVFPVVLQSNAAFIPESHPFYVLAVYYVMTALFLFGLISYADGPGTVKKYRGLFWLVLWAVWLYLMIQKKIVLSPTRHSLVLLPFMAMTIAEGFGYLFERLGRGNEAKWMTIEKRAGSTAAVFALCLFLSGFGGFLEKRRDPFNEKEIASVVKRFDADMLIRVDYTLQPVFMKSLSEWFSFREEGWPTHELLYKRGPENDTLVWLSHRWKLTEENFEKARIELNTFIMASNVKRYLTGRKSVPIIEPHFRDYQIVFKEEKDSDVQIDFSRRTRNGSNNFYFYVLKKKTVP